MISSRTIFASFAALALALAAPACSSGPDARTGTRGGIIEELRVGRSCAARLSQSYGLVQDAAATRYLNQVAGALGRVSTRQELTFHTAILDTDDVRVFACPAGYILVSKGALAKLEDEAELAFLLGVQVAHTDLRHLAEHFSGVPSTEVESTVDGLVAQLQEDGPGGDAVLESDRAAAGYLYALGYDITAGARVLARFDQASPYADVRPSSQARLESLEEFLTENGLSQVGGQDNKGRFAASVRY